MATTETVRYPKLKDAYEFEKLTRDVMEIKYPGRKFELYGRNGQSQEGIDIKPSNSGEVICAQCKNYNEMKQNDIEHILNKVTYSELTTLIIATSVDRDRKLQDKIAELNKKQKYKYWIEIWFWDDFESIIYDSEELLKKYYPRYTKTEITNEFISKKSMEYFSRIEKLYRIQNYAINIKDDYFFAEQKSGVIKSKALVIPIYTAKEKLSSDEILKILDILQKEKGLYQHIHIVTNGILETMYRDMFSDYKHIIEKLDENKIIGQIMDFTEYLENSINTFKKSNLCDHYIEILDKRTGESLDDSVRKFLNQNQYNALLILGDYGCGKTSFLLNYQSKLAEAYLSGTGEYIPIFIPLKKYAKAVNMDNLFLDIFINEYQTINLNIQALKFMFKYMKFVLLFDGFDEAAKRVNYDVKFEIFNQICQYCSGNTKIVVTCRPNYFQEKREYKNLIESAHLQFEPNIINNAVFDETFIAELTEKQIHKYISSYEKELSEKGFEVSQIEELIANTHDLTDLSHRPFLLNIIVQTLPQIISDLNRETEKTVIINAAVLYKKYTDLWLDRENQKGKSLISKKDKLYFCMHIAYKMFKENNSTIHFSKMPAEIKEYFSDLKQMDEIDYFSHDIQSCSFMNSDGDGNFSFIHKSFMEYFVARYITETLQDCKKGETENVIKVLEIRDISIEVALFINDILCDDVELYSKLKAILIRLISSSEGRIKRNIVTILSKMDYNIADSIKDGDIHKRSDFSHSFIKEKVIYDVDFTGATFYEAIIHDVKFVNCIFSDAVFQKAKLKNVDFSKQNLEYVDMSYCEIEHCNFEETLLVEARFSQSLLQNNNFKNCDMSGVEANGARFKNNINCQSVFGAPYELA